MLLDEIAKGFCAAAHNLQKRKYTNEPYYYHPWEVGNILFQEAEHIETVIAGYLHDVLEDTNVGQEVILDVFGEDVLKIVLEVTDTSKPEDGNRAVRKAMDRAHLAKSSYAGATVKLADLISNTSSIMKFDPDFAKIYLKEKEAVLEVLKHGNKTLWDRAYKTIAMD